jgi:hypothetical protein
MALAMFGMRSFPVAVLINAGDSILLGFPSFEQIETYPSPTVN